MMKIKVQADAQMVKTEEESEEEVVEESEEATVEAING
jgi:hypothetical protein